MKPSPSDRPLSRLLRYARRYHGRVALASAYSVINKLFDLAPPLLIGAAVDIVVEREASLLARWGVVDSVDQLLWLTFATVAVWGLESLFEYAYAVEWRNLAQDLQHDIRLDAYRHAQSLDQASFETRGTGGLLSVLNDDVNQLERFLDGGANNLLQVFTTVVAIGFVFFGFSPTIALMAFAPIPLILWGSFRYQATLAPRYSAVREQVGILNNLLSNSLSGIAAVKSYTAEEREAARVDEASRAYRVRNASAIRLSSAFSPLIRMVIVIGFGATLFYGGLLTLDGELEVGAYSVLVFMTQRLLWPLTRLGVTFDLFQRAMASTRRIFALLDETTTIHGGPTALETSTVRGSIAFEGVDFVYPNGFSVLEGFDVTIEAGQSIAFVGATGSGKTTLIKLLLRFYDPTGGQVYLDGYPLTELRLDSLRAAIGLVSQDVFLFPGSIADNIRYGRPDATGDEIEEVARWAEAHRFIEAMPQGYDTPIGERGIRLSGGQRQRIAIARALLKSPPVLVLDEATSAVDNETEAALQRSLERITAGRTTILIAHRLSTVRNVDRIYVLEDGAIIESGTHDELVARRGSYWKLWCVQTGER